MSSFGRGWSLGATSGWPDALVASVFDSVVIPPSPTGVTAEAAAVEVVAGGANPKVNPVDAEVVAVSGFKAVDARAKQKVY